MSIEDDIIVKRPTKPEGPAQEPQSMSEDEAKRAVSTMRQWLRDNRPTEPAPATPAPSQPAGARPRDLRKRGDDYKAAWELAESELEALAQQTAAKDTEIAELKRDIESDFMQGTYARLKALQAAERELAQLRQSFEAEAERRFEYFCEHRMRAAERERDSLASDLQGANRMIRDYDERLKALKAENAALKAEKDGQQLSALDVERAAIKSAVDFIEKDVAPRPCDSDGVSNCVRCNAVYLAKKMAQVLKEHDDATQ